MRIQTNVIVLGGNLTCDPEIKHLDSGSKVCKFRMAANEDHKKDGEEKKEITTFVEVNTWGKLAKACSEFLSKGDCVIVQGKVRYNAWETDEGEKRSKVFIQARSVQFLDTKKRREDVEHPDSPEDVSSAVPEKTDEEIVNDTLPF